MLKDFFASSCPCYAAALNLKRSLTFKVILEIREFVLKKRIVIQRFDDIIKSITQTHVIGTVKTKGLSQFASVFDTHVEILLCNFLFQGLEFLSLSNFSGKHIETLISSTWSWVSPMKFSAPGIAQPTGDSTCSLRSCWFASHVCDLISVRQALASSSRCLSHVPRIHGSRCRAISPPLGIVFLQQFHSRRKDSLSDHVSPTQPQGALAVFDPHIAAPSCKALIREESCQRSEGVRHNQPGCQTTHHSMK